METFLVGCLALLLCSTVTALECDSDRLKITIKTDPAEYDFDAYEQYLLKGTVAYAIRKFCGGGTDKDSGEYNCGTSPGTIDTVDVEVTNITERIAMCVKVDGIITDTVRISLKESKANLNGALILTDDLLFIDGIEPTLEPEYKPDFATWIIVYIVLACLIVLAGIAMVVYTKYYTNDKEKAEKASIVDESHSEPDLVKENLSYEPDSAVGSPEENSPAVTML